MAISPDALRLGRRGGSAAPRPLQQAFQLPALNASVCEARRRVLARLCTWGVDEEVRDDAALIVSELFTNAIRHTGSGRIGCELRLDGDRVRLEVTDQGGGSVSGPRTCDADVDDEGGRGLLLVGMVSDRWGVRHAETGGGRVVWAELPRRRPGVMSSSAGRA